MKRWLATLIVLTLITGGVIWEQIYVKQTFDTLNQQLDALITAVNACTDDTVDTNANQTQIDAMVQYWRQRERVLCYLVKHTETLQISDALLYAQNFIHFGNKEETMSALNKLKYLFEIHHYNLGTSLENII